MLQLATLNFIIHSGRNLSCGFNGYANRYFCPFSWLRDPDIIIAAHFLHCVTDESFMIDKVWFNLFSLKLKLIDGILELFRVVNLLWQVWEATGSTLVSEWRQTPLVGKFSVHFLVNWCHISWLPAPAHLCPSLDWALSCRSCSEKSFPVANG